MNQITAILADFSEVDPADMKPESRLVEDLGLTSLDLLDAVTAFEDAWNLEISDEDIRSLHTLQDIEDYIRAHA